MHVKKNIKIGHNYSSYS